MQNPEAEVEAFLHGFENREELKTCTIEATLQSGRSGNEGVQDDLPLPSVTVGDAGVPHFRPQRVLGRGGMGVVHLAEQTGMSRVVALKTVHPSQRDLGKPALLREARVMALLEHPNVVPVHIIGGDDSATPYVAMKFVQGRALVDLYTAQPTSEYYDRIAEIGVAMTHALEYAHSKGVLHLDLKPANVMVGDFGEVYVVDWGSALAYGDHNPPGVPHMRDLKKIVGTPGFIAPEMVSLEVPFGPYTDIYLLGGTLFAMLNGTPPNAASTSTEAITRSYKGELSAFRPDVPESLQKILLKALARNPGDRWTSMQALRDALTAWRANRVAGDLVGRAFDAVTRLEDALSGKGRDQVDLYRLYGAARNALEQVAPSLDIQLASQRATVAMIDFELRRDNPGAAEALLRDLPNPDRDVEKRVHAAAEAHRLKLEKAEALAHLEEDVNPWSAPGVKATVWGAIGLGIAATQVIPAAMGFKPDVAQGALAHGVFAALVGGVIVGFRKVLFSTTANRNLSLAIVVMVAFALVVRILAVIGRFDQATALGLDLSFVTFMCTFAVFGIDRRAMLVVPGYALGAATAFAMPGAALVVFGVTHMLNMFIMGSFYGLQWLRESKK